MTVTAAALGWETISVSNSNHPHTLIPSWHTWISLHAAFGTFLSFRHILSFPNQFTHCARAVESVRRFLPGWVLLTGLILLMLQGFWALVQLMLKAIQFNYNNQRVRHIVQQRKSQRKLGERWWVVKKARKRVTFIISRAKRSSTCGTVLEKRKPAERTASKREKRKGKGEIRTICCCQNDWTTFQTCKQAYLWLCAICSFRSSLFALFLRHSCIFLSLMVISLYTSPVSPRTSARFVLNCATLCHSRPHLSTAWRIIVSSMAVYLQLGTFFLRCFFWEPWFFDSCWGWQLFEGIVSVLWSAALKNILSSEISSITTSSSPWLEWRQHPKERELMGCETNNNDENKWEVGCYHDALSWGCDKNKNNTVVQCSPKIEGAK